jgi:hypothetical protein
MTAKPPFRPITYAPPKISCESSVDGSLRLRSSTPLEPYEPSLARLFRAAVETAPARCFLAERDESGGWRKLSYEDARPTVDAIAQALRQAASRRDRDRRVSGKPSRIQVAPTPRGRLTPAICSRNNSA